MSKSKQKSIAFYRAALQVLRHGYIDNITGKRQGKFADGFEASDGFDLRKMSSWTPAQKSKITRLFKFVDLMTSRPYQVYRTKNKKNLRRVQQAAQHGIFPKALKVAFVPSNSKRQRVKIRITKKAVKFKQGMINRVMIDFEAYGYGPDDLARDPVGVVRDVVSQSAADLYRIQAGEFEVSRGKSLPRLGDAWDADYIGDAVSRMVNYYSSDKYDAGDTSSSYFGNWLFGVVGYTFDKLKDYKSYRADYERATRKNAVRRATLRRKLKRKITDEKDAKRKNNSGLK